MNTKFLGLQNAADAVITDATSRSKILAAAIALAVSASLALPTSEVDNTSEYYAHNVQGEVRRWIGDFNENLVFDRASALELARQYWLLRYTAAHPLRSPIYSLREEHSFFDAISGVGVLIEQSHYEFANKFRAQILLLAAHANTTLNELKQAA